MSKETIGPVPGYANTSTPDHAGLIQLNAVVGRFALYLTAPQSAV